jgi:hypothetical protein
MITALSATSLSPTELDPTLGFGVDLTARLSTGNILTLPIRWSPEDVGSQATPTQISALFQALIVNAIDSLQDVAAEHSKE